MGGAGYIIVFMSHRALQAKESKGGQGESRTEFDPKVKALSKAGKQGRVARPIGAVVGSSEPFGQETSTDVLCF